MKSNLTFEKIISTVVTSIINFFVNLWKNIKKISLAIGLFFKRLFLTHKEIIQKGNWFTRGSYLIMGLGQVFQKQIIKGIIFFLTEVAFIYIMVVFSSRYLANLFDLGTIVSRLNPDTQVREMVHHSPTILLYCVLSIFIIIGFIMALLAAAKSSYHNQLLLASGKQPKTFKAEMDQFLNDKFHITLLSLPTLGVVLFTIVPLIFMILIAFIDYGVKQPTSTTLDWVGFANFKKVLFSNPNMSYTFWYLLRWTLTWAFFATFTNYFGGMLLALLINKKGVKGKKIWRLFFVLSIAVPQFVSLLLMNQLFQELGLINNFLIKLGWIDKPIPFLSSVKYSRILVICINMWIGIPYSMLITSGLLMNIPVDLYESASIDGASPFKRFLHITMPYILFATAPFLITQFIGNINNFNVIYLLTGGGPNLGDLYQAGGTDLLVTWLFKLTVDRQEYSLASTIGCMLFAVCSILSLIIYNKTAAVKHEGDMQ